MGLKQKKICWMVALILSWNCVGAETFRMGILPVIDTLPLQVALKEGDFKEAGLNVKLVPFMSAMERNTAMHSGQLDGFFGDILATLLLAKNRIPIKFLTVSYRTNPGQRMFGLVLSPSLGKSPEKAVLTVAMSKSTIIEYLLDQMRPMAETSRYQLKYTEIMRMPIRLQMLLTDRIDAALLPEPLLTLAESKGAHLIVTDQTLDLPLTVLNIHQSKISHRAAFLKAYRKAVVRLNETPEKYRKLMGKTCRIPKHLVNSFPMYRYPLPQLPTEDEVKPVQNWMVKQGLLNRQIPYQQLIH